MNLPSIANMKERSWPFSARTGRFVSASVVALLLFPLEGPGHNTPVKPPPTPLPVSGAVAVDPVRNTEDPISGAPLDGGVRYRWTVNLAGNGSTRFWDAVGAWGWDEDGDSETERGRTEAAHWIALNLKSPSRITIRVSRKANVDDPEALFPGDVAGSNLVPAFTLYSGWENDGGDESTFPNRGNVPWAEDLAYIDHVEPGESAVAGTFSLPAGRYSVALGGSSTSLLPEGRQGYEATFSSVSLERVPKYRLTRRNRPVSKAVLRLTGRIGSPGEITRLKVFFHGRTRTVAVRRGAWSATLRGLEKGRNVVWLTPVSKYGTFFRPQRLVIRRR